MRPHFRLAVKLDRLKEFVAIYFADVFKKLVPKTHQLY